MLALMTFFLGKQVGAIRREQHALEGETSRPAAAGCRIARILDPVEGQRQAAAEGARRQFRCGDLPTASTVAGVGK